MAALRGQALSHALGESSQPDEMRTLPNAELRACGVGEPSTRYSASGDLNSGRSSSRRDFPATLSPPSGGSGAVTTPLSGEASGPPPWWGHRGCSLLGLVLLGSLFWVAPPVLHYCSLSIRIFCAHPSLPPIFKTCQEEVKTEREFCNMNCYASCF